MRSDRYAFTSSSTCRAGVGQGPALNAEVLEPTQRAAEGFRISWQPCHMTERESFVFGYLCVGVFNTTCAVTRVNLHCAKA